jgi:hypothetical protein
VVSSVLAVMHVAVAVIAAKLLQREPAELVA